jgi:ATP-dependent RNA helicase MSS116, mitochondrial
MGPDKRAIDSKAVDILVATPGRMLAHMQETDGTVQMCSGVRVLVLDEADRLLDMGFKRDLDKIMSFLPQGRQPAKGRGGAAHGTGSGTESGVPRQTLLFSATFSEEVKQIAAVTLRQGYSIVDTVGEEVEQTHAHVTQHMMVVPLGEIHTVEYAERRGLHLHYICRLLFLDFLLTEPSPCHNYYIGRQRIKCRCCVLYCLSR